MSCLLGTGRGNMHAIATGPIRSLQKGRKCWPRDPFDPFCRFSLQATQRALRRTQGSITEPPCESLCDRFVNKSIGWICIRGDPYLIKNAANFKMHLGIQWFQCQKTSTGSSMSSWKIRPGRRADVIRHCPSPTLCVSWLDVTGCDCYGYPMDLWISSGDLCQTANLAGWCWNLLKWFRNVDSQSLGKWLLHGFCGSVNLWHMVSLTPLLELREWERRCQTKFQPTSFRLLSCTFRTCYIVKFWRPSAMPFSLSQAYSI